MKPIELEPVFPAVEPASEVYGRLVELRDVIANDPELLSAPEVRAELLPRRLASGEAIVRRFYWSARRTDPTLPLGFSARTLYTHQKRPALQTFDFPDEPVMDWLTDDSGPLRSHGSLARIEMLRYIPVRRVTFRLHGGAGLPSPVIAKTMRESDLLQANRVLEATWNSVQQLGNLDFAVPRPVGLDVDRRLLYLEQLPGTELAQMLDQLDEHQAMHRLGVIQRDLHELVVPGADTRTCADWLAAAHVATEQVAMLAPSTAEQMAELSAELTAKCPADADLAFCQGNFTPSQILCAPSGWAVLDLDDGHYADPHAEVAALYAALPRELRLPEGARAEALRSAYLDGYLQRGGRDLDAARWHWFLTVAVLRYLARRLVKNRAVPGEPAAVLANLPAAIG